MKETRVRQNEELFADRETTREAEMGEASEPDAPTSVSENAGMSTILDSTFSFGVQADADEAS